MDYYDLFWEIGLFLEEMLVDFFIFRLGID